MSNRFRAIGSFVYEKGNRIGVTPDEASAELARKLNAYQMRIERLKAEVERLRASSFVTAVPVEEYEKLKAEGERLRKAGDGVVERLRILGANSDYSMYFINAWNAAKEGKQP